MARPAVLWAVSGCAGGCAYAAVHQQLPASCSCLSSGACAGKTPSACPATTVSAVDQHALSNCRILASLVLAAVLSTFDHTSQCHSNCLFWEPLNLSIGECVGRLRRRQPAASRRLHAPSPDCRGRPCPLAMTDNGGDWRPLGHLLRAWVLRAACMAVVDIRLASSRTRHLRARDITSICTP